MVEQLKERYGQLPDEYLADVGFVHLDDIKQLTEWGVTPYLPIKDEKKNLKDSFEGEGFRPIAKTIYSQSHNGPCEKFRVKSLRSPPILARHDSI